MSEQPKSKLALLKKKARATKTIDVVIDSDTGDSVELTFGAVPGAVYDLLLAAAPPSPADRKQNVPYNLAKFAPTLIAASLVDPQITEEEAYELWDNDNWNRGERMILFSTAVEVSTSPLSSTKRG